MRIKQLLLVSLTCAAALATSAQAQYPERAIKLVVPQAPGSATDNGARILARSCQRSSANLSSLRTGQGRFRYRQ